MKWKTIINLSTSSIFGLLLILLLVNCSQAVSPDTEEQANRCPVRTNTYNTPFGGRNVEINWSPSGQEFLFGIFHDGKSKIYIGSLESGLLQPLFNEEWEDKNNYFADWSPDGQTIIFASNDANTSKAGIYQMDVETDIITQLVTPGNRPLWSPEGDKIAYTIQSELHIMDVDGNNDQPISEIGLLQMWHPKVETMLMQLGGGIDNLPDDIGVVDINTKEVTQLTSTTECENSPRWFPDGQRIAYVSLQNDGNFDIFSMQSDGSNSVNLTNSPLKHEFEYTLSPNGEQVAYVVFHATDYDEHTQKIYVMDANGENVVQLTNSHEDEFMPSWSPDGEYIVYLKESCMSYQSNKCNSWSWSINYMKPDGSEPTLFAKFQSE